MENKYAYKTKREQLQQADIVVLIALDSAPGDSRWYYNYNLKKVSGSSWQESSRRRAVGL